MLRDITIGQYFPGGSLLHRLDPRMKLVIIFAAIIFVFVASSVFSIGLMLLATVSLIFCTGISFKFYIRGLKPVFLIILLTSALNIFYVKTGLVLVHWKFITITSDGLLRSALIAVRIAVMILLSCVLTYTTSPSDLTDALERLLSPLKVFKIKVHEFAMIMTIALRFVPTLLRETDRITSAQKARGADFESGGLIQRMKAMIPILIPLLASAFQRAYDLAMAMECRCYHGGEGRTRMKQLKLCRRDFAVAVAFVILFAGVMVCNRFSPSLR